jgi:hypothetical protein
MKMNFIKPCKHVWVPGFADRGVRHSRPGHGIRGCHSTMMPIEGWNEFEAHCQSIAEHCPKCLLERYVGKDGKTRYSTCVRDRAIKNPKFLHKYLAEIKDFPNPSIFKEHWIDGICNYLTLPFKIPTEKEMRRFMRSEKEQNKKQIAYCQINTNGTLKSQF